MTYEFLGSPDISAAEQRKQLNFVHCCHPADVMVNLEYGNVTARCKCGVRVRMSIPKLVGVLEFLDNAGLPHDIGMFIRASKAVAV